MGAFCCQEWRDLAPADTGSSPHAGWRESCRLGAVISSAALGTGPCRVKPAVVDWNGDGQARHLARRTACGSFLASRADGSEERRGNARRRPTPDCVTRGPAAFQQYQQLQNALRPPADGRPGWPDGSGPHAEAEDEIARVQEIQALRRASVARFSGSSSARPAPTNHVAMKRIFFTIFDAGISRRGVLRVRTSRRQFQHGQ